MVDVFRNPLGRSGPEMVLARRREAWLEMLTAGVSVFCGVFFGAVFVAEHPRGASALWGAGVGIVAVAAVAALRAKRPAHIKEPHLIEIARTAAADESVATSADERAGWDLGNIVIAAIFLPPLIIIGLLAVCWLPVLIIIGFAVQAGSGATLGLALALTCTFVTMGAVEYGISLPLARRWQLPEFD